MGFESGPSFLKPETIEKENENAGAFRMGPNGALEKVSLEEATNTDVGWRENVTQKPLETSTQENDPNIPLPENRVQQFSQEDIQRMIKEEMEKEKTRQKAA